jgi:uncharacterized protein (DUF58 family)
VVRALRARLRRGFFRWALRGRTAERLPIVFTQQRIYVLPSGAGVAFAIMLILNLVGTINYNLSLGYVWTFLLMGLGVLAILHTFRNLARLELLPGRCPPVFAGQEAVFGVFLVNHRDTPRYNLCLNLPQQPACCLEVPARGQAEALLSLPARQRGWLELPLITLTTTWPLGLVRVWAYAAPALRCLVYPTPADTAPPLPVVPGAASGMPLPGRGTEDFAGLRGHQPGDPLRHVAWKVAARQEHLALQTKLFSGAAAQSLWLDWDALPAALGIEQRLSLLTRWVCDAYAAGVSWGVRLPGVVLKPASDAAHYHLCLKHLALYGLPAEA